MKQLLDNAISTMEEAIELYKTRQFDQAIAKRSLAEELFSAYDNQLNIELENDKTLYGDNINLGLIDCVVQKNIKDLTQNGSLSADNTSFIRSYTNALKSNTNCKAQYNIYNKLSKNIDPNYCDDYIELVLSTYMPQINKEGFISDNRSILPQLRNETTFNEYVEIDDLDIDLYSTIESLIETYKSPEHFQSYIESKRSLEELLRQKYSSNTDSSEDSLTTHEFDFLNRVSNMSNEEQEVEFNTLKQRVKEIIKEKAITSDIDNLPEWIEIYKKIEGKIYNSETSLSDLSELTELIETLE